jgi:hypothetical protein
MDESLTDRQTDREEERAREKEREADIHQGRRRGTSKKRNT